MTKEISKYFSDLAKKQHAQYTPEERSERMRKMVNARWEKYRKEKLSPD